MKTAAKQFHVGGIESVLEMLRVMDNAEREKLLRLVSVKDAKLAESLREKIFVFDDLIFLTSKETQLLIRSLGSLDLGLALKSAKGALIENFCENLSQRMAEDLRNSIKFMGPKLARDVQNMQSKIMEVAKKLEEEGKLTLKKAHSKVVR